MTGFYVQSMLANKVIEVPADLAEVGAALDASAIAKNYFSVPTSAETQAAGYQLWNLSSVAGFGSPCFFESALDGNLVIGFKGVIDPESERGPELQLSTKNNGDTSQLWQLSPHDDDYFFIQSVRNPDYVIDIREGLPDRDTVQVFRKKTKNLQNQLWRTVPFYVDITAHIGPSLSGPVVIYFNGGKVLILPGNDPAKGTTVVGSPFGPNFPGGLDVGKTL
jgi:hypothetical protein